MGYSSEDLRARYVTYADRFGEGARVADLGCGRGEFLELLRERGGAGIGVDLDADMLAEVRAKGLETYEGDAVEFLRRSAGELDGVFAAHLAEHLTPDRLEALVEAAAAALSPGGRLILVTPNPRNLEMQLRDFWIDLQHVRFYSPEIIRWLFHKAGLKDVEAGENPLYGSGPKVAREPAPPLPVPANSRPRKSGLGRGLSRVRERATRRLLPHSVEWRLAELELRVNAVSGWMHSLYPPAEYYVSGIR